MPIINRKALAYAVLSVLDAAREPNYQTGMLSNTVCRRVYLLTPADKTFLLTTAPEMKLQEEGISRVESRLICQALPLCCQVIIVN